MRKSYGFLKRALGLVFLGFVTLIVVYPQNNSNDKSFAKVSLVMPLVLEGHEESIPGGNLGVEPYLLSAKGKKKIRLVSRDYVGNRGNFIDKFEIRVPPGSYRVQFKGLEQYLLPTFNVGANETYTFRLPQERLLNPDVCMNEDIYTKTFFVGETDRDYEKRYREEPFHKLESDVVAMDTPYEMVVQYCQKSLKGDSVHYGPSRFYYKNFYVEANDVSIDRTLRRVEATAYFVEVGGMKQEVTEKKFEFSY